MSKKRLRECPALGKGITPAECGENRIGRYACPESCAFNPYSIANYEQLFEMGDAFSKAVADRVAEDPTAQEELRRRGVSRTDDELVLTAALDTIFYRHRDEAGLTFADRWERAGLKGLRNDHRVFFAGRRNPRISLLEILEVGEGGRLVCVDLLDDPEDRRVFVDKSFAARACRFECLVGITYRMPHYSCVNGTALALVEVHGIGPREVLSEMVAHLGGRLEQDWLFENIARVQEAVFATERERSRIALMETDHVSATVEYALSGSVESMAEKLEAGGWLSDKLSPEESRDGFERSFLAPNLHESDELSELIVGQMYSGAVALKEGRARLTAIRADELTGLRSRLESIGEGSLSFESELVRDLAKAKALELPESVQGLVPPRLLEGADGVRKVRTRIENPTSPDPGASVAQSFIERYYRSLLDKEMDFLGGLTPRAAAASEEQRPKLLAWAKGLVRSVDRQNLGTGEGVAIGWLAGELGLPEIDSPAPPPRPVLGAGEDSRDAEDDFDDDDFSDEDIIGGEALYFEDRIEERMEEYPEFKDALAAMEASGCRLIGEMLEEMSGRLSEHTLNLCVAPMVLAWLALFEENERVVLRPGMVERAVREAHEEFTVNPEGLTLDRYLEEIDRVCLEPGLLLELWKRLRNARDGLQRKDQVSDKEYGGMMIVILAAVNVLVEAGDSETDFG